MSQPTQPRPIVHFKVGFELELVVALRKELLESNVGANESWETVAGILATHLSDMLQAGDHPPANVGEALNGVYSGLSLVRDPSIRGVDDQFEKTKWPIEFVSPVLTTIGDGASNFVFAFFASLSPLAVAEPVNSTCGLHVHISPHRLSPGGWAFEELKAIARAIVVFDPTMDALIPEGRRTHNVYCATNIHAAGVEADLATGGHYATVFDRIESFNDVPDLIAYISTDVRQFAWDFGHLAEDRCGTLEFRRPPMCTQAAVVVAWIEFVAMFTLAAVSDEGKLVVDSFRNRHTRPTLQELFDFVITSRPRVAYSLKGQFARTLFFERDKTMKQYDPSMTRPLSFIDVDAMAALNEKVEMKKKYAAAVAKDPAAKIGGAPSAGTKK